MKISIRPPTKPITGKITITGSKSETNRMLLLQALFPCFAIQNESNSEDTVLMKKALQLNNDTIDVHHAGTAMRFLTSYFAIQENKEVLLTGSHRMKERPIKLLVEALRFLGADIMYEDKEGYPPIRIKGKQLHASKVSLPAHISSQYISSLLLIAPKLEYGLEVTLVGTVTSMPYIKMTLVILEKIGIETQIKKNIITVKPLKKLPHKKQLVVESDWSSASYFYSIVALGEVGTQIELSTYKRQSLQGDAVLADWYTFFGVQTQFKKKSVVLTKQKKAVSEYFKANLEDTPDIAQTIAVTCFGLGIACELTGLHTLKIKETDRLEALKIELSKLGADISVTDKALFLKSRKQIYPNIAIETYHDHRMAMAFAPLGFVVPIRILDATVVSKSYPGFWRDLKSIGFQIRQL